MKVIYIFLIFLMLGLRELHLLQEKKERLDELLIVITQVILSQHIMLEDIKF